MRPTNYFQQNTVCLKQQIDARQENFTQLLVVMVETFRRCRWIFIINTFESLGIIQSYRPIPSKCLQHHQQRLCKILGTGVNLLL